MAAKKTHKASSEDDNKAKDNLHEEVQKVIAGVIAQVACDYRTLFAKTDDSGEDALCERHKQGKIIASHLEALLKINDTYIEPHIDNANSDYNQHLIDTARSDLNDAKS